MSRSNDVTTFFRLSAHEADLIRPGLLRVTSGHYLWTERGSPSCSPSRMLFQASRIDEGEYSAEYLATVSRVIVAASFTDQSRRLRLDPFELACCLLGLRATEMLARHGHTEAWLPNHEAASRKLLAKLERLRKRAKRAFIRAHGHAAFTEASRRWQKCVRFARAYFVYCRCNRPRLPGGGAKARRRLIVEHWIKNFRQELPIAGLRVPGEKELRYLVRRALRSARRLMAPMGLTEVREQGEYLRDRVRNFVVARCREQPGESPASVECYRIEEKSKSQRRKEMKTIKTKAQAETSNTEYLAGIWCARWTQRLMPDSKLRSTVLHLVARQLQFL